MRINNVQWLANHQVLALLRDNPLRQMATRCQTVLPNVGNNGSAATNYP